MFWLMGLMEMLVDAIEAKVDDGLGRKWERGREGESWALRFKLVVA